MSSKIVICLWVIISVASCSAEFTESACNERCKICSPDGSTCKECIYGWHGYYCHRKCHNCWVSGCNELGRCDQCKPGRYREDCRSHCPANCRYDTNNDVFCRRADGKCLDGCRTGWWGDTCDRKCSEHCDDRGCLQENGHCIGSCKSGWWGLKCDKMCSVGCKDKSCRLLTGECVRGCVVGFTGNTCSKPINCNGNNFKQGDDIMLGKCLGGCKSGWASNSCNVKCPGTCKKCHQTTRECEECPKSTYGPFCTQDCSLNCRDDVCDMKGNCKTGCKDGFMGASCEQPCPSNCLKCDQNGETCTECKVDWTGKTCEESNNPSEPDKEAQIGMAEPQHYSSKLVTVCFFFSLILMTCC